MVTWATGFVRVVADGDVFLPTVAGVDGGVPVGDAVLREGVVEEVFAAAHPGTGLRGGEPGAKTAKGIFATEVLAVDPKNAGDGLIVLKAAAVGKAFASDQTVEHEGLEDVPNGGGIGAGARHRIGLGKEFDDAGALKEVIPSDQSTVGGQLFVAIAEVEFAPAGSELEAEGVFTHRVKFPRVRFGGHSLL